MPAWLSYTLLRIGLFALVFTVLLLLGIEWLWAAVTATVVAFCVAYIFFRGRRLALAEQWANRRPSSAGDDAAEDSELERDAPGASASPGPSGGDGERQRRAEP